MIILIPVLSENSKNLDNYAVAFQYLLRIKEFHVIKSLPSVYQIGCSRIVTLKPAFNAGSAG